MSEKRQPGVIGSLPSTRPHRRSGRRAAPADPGNAPTPADGPPAAHAPDAPDAPAPAAPAHPPAGDTPGAPAPAADTPAPKPRRAKPAAARTQAADRSSRRAPARPRADPEPPDPAPASPGALQTAVEAAAELTEIGLRASARALRAALSRLPKP